MAKKKPCNVSQRSFYGILYADNREHMQALKRLQRGALPFVAAWHTETVNGSEIVKGEGKKHMHFVLHFENARKWKKVAELLGVTWDDGIGAQFLRPVGFDKKYFWEKGSDKRRQLWGAMVYLTHRNAFEKVQYPVSVLFGAPDLVETAKYRVMLEEERQIDRREAIAGIARWAAAQTEPITAFSYLAWVKDTPYFRFSETGFAMRLIEDRNKRLYGAIAAQFGSIDISPEKRASFMLPPPESVEIVEDEFEDLLINGEVVPF